jgi:hypothetical protein
MRRKANPLEFAHNSVGVVSNRAYGDEEGTVFTIDALLGVETSNSRTAS